MGESVESFSLSSKREVEDFKAQPETEKESGGKLGYDVDGKTGRGGEEKASLIKAAGQWPQRHTLE